LQNYAPAAPLNPPNPQGKTRNMPSRDGKSKELCSQRPGKSSQQFREVIAYAAFDL
jgi:hypothetical protein